MQEYIHFLIQHWELSLAFVVIFLYWVFTEWMESHSGHGIDSVHLVHLMNREHAVVVDIREAKSFEEGHILGSLSYPEKDFLKELNKLKKYRSKPLVLIDSKGIISSRIITKVIAAGFEKAKYLKNGMGTWKEAKLPLEKGKSNAKN
jgi:rhodanese-related sulfurtransferase